MVFFRRDNTAPAKSGLPSDVVQMMERFGRHEYDIANSAEDGYSIWLETQAPLEEMASNDPSGFAVALATNVTTLGGWAAYGAGRTVMNLLPEGGKGIPEVGAVLDGAIAFLRERRVSLTRVGGYELDRWFAMGGTAQSWLPS